MKQSKESDLPSHHSFVISASSAPKMLGGLRGWLGASMKESPLETSESSLRRADGGPRRIAVMVDSSNESEYAFRWAVANIVDKETDHVTLVSVATPQPFSDSPVIGSEVDAPLETPDEAAERSRLEIVAAKEKASIMLGKLAAAGKERGVKHLSTAVLEAKSVTLAGPLLCEWTANNSTDVAILGSHGRTLSSMLLSVIGLGRVSDYAVKSLQCPVTVVKHKPADIEMATRHARAARQQAEQAALKALQQEHEALRRRQKGL